ncbi:hypothetical protein [Mucilaginibacter arboris]|uniref:Uncharacterized protein n=1 Tax=Mucilaginibacter arboris TaxID=2682090 RepID=A0A7K1SXS6_9SPHI|nr:hypothetical protein [Mucilaginibacter arboris]MVN22131.1 hypothetical protein [Mucilaginibacter arboris]
MRKPNLLKLLLPVGLLLLICSLFIGHFTKISEPLNGFFKGLGITLIVAYFLKASLTKTVW